MEFHSSTTRSRQRSTSSRAEGRAGLTPFQQRFLAPPSAEGSVASQEEGAPSDRAESFDSDSLADPRGGATPFHAHSRSDPFPQPSAPISHPFNRGFSPSLTSVPAPPSPTTEGMRRVRSLGAVGSQRPPPSMELPDLPFVASSSGTRRGEAFGGAEGGGGGREPKHLPRWDESQEGSIESARGVRGEGDGVQRGYSHEAERRGGASTTVEAQDGHEQDGLGDGELGDGSPAPSSGSVTPPRSEHSARLGYGRTSPIQSQPTPDHLPFLEEGSREATARANWNVASELEFAISRVVGEHVLEEMMRDKNAMRRFRDYISAQPDSDPLLLDFYNDLSVLTSLTTRVRLACESLEQIYLVKSSPARLALPISIRGPVIESLHRSADVGLGILAPQAELLSALYSNEFQAFVQEKLVEHCVARLSTWNLQSTGESLGKSDGLADCYCLQVLASEGFAALTGYDIDLIVGRNCRFLQGPGTAPTSVKRLHEALARGVGITSLLLNYRRDGTPFFNLLCMLPLKDSSGTVKYFLGGQIDVTSSLSSLSSPFAALSSFAPGSANDTTPTNAPITTHTPKFSPAVQKHQNTLIAATKKHGGVVVDGKLTSGFGVSATGVNGVDQDDDESGILHVRKKGSVVSSGAVPAPINVGGAGGGSGVGASRRPSVDVGGPGTTKGGPASEASTPGSPRSADSSSGRGRGMLGGVGKKLRNVASGLRGNGGELGVTAEEQERMVGVGAKQQPLLSRISEFEATYSRVILIRKSTLEILFVTPQLLTFCGLAPSLAASLIGLNFIKILTSPKNGGSGEDSDRKHRIRRNVKASLEHGHSFACPVGLMPAKAKGGRGLGGILTGSNGHDKYPVKECILHLTPLCDRDGGVEAFVAVFG